MRLRWVICLASCLVAAVPAATMAGETAVAESAARVSPNRLSDSGSPYLLQHADNPVDWYPWGEEALDKARREGKPIFVSIGYSACHWCHVANRTLYAKPEIAALMNRWFVNIKVDREQRPDLDAIYMLATTLMTGRVGWPNNLFLTPELKPFFAGSYFPPADDAFGRPGFERILRRIHADWTERRDAIERDADDTMRAIREAQHGRGEASRPIDAPAWLVAARARLRAQFDEAHGGFHAARDEDAKFPHPPLLGLLVADVRENADQDALDMLVASLDAMAQGGIHDHVGGGFHRYAVERTWSMPHFEKMLYDNAQLLRLYAEAWQLTRKPLYRAVAERTGDYLLRRLTAPEGGFYTAEDAEAAGLDGSSYTWTSAEIEAALGADVAQAFLSAHELTPLAAQREDDILDGVTRGVLRMRLLPRTGTPTPELAGQRAALLAAREARPQPARDEKLVLALNGLAIDALAVAGKLLPRPDYVQAAERAASRLWALAYDERARRLRHALYRGTAAGEGFLDDYAHLAIGLVSLAEATAEPLWRRRAARLADDALQRFARDDGGLAVTTGAPDLPMAPIDSGDDAYPSGTSAMVELLLRLARAADGATYHRAAGRLLAVLSGRVHGEPQRWPALIAAALGTRAGDFAHPSPESPPPLAVPDSAHHVAVGAIHRRVDGGEEIVVRLHIAPGFHVNANPASHDYLIPTELRFESLEPLRIQYPQPKLFTPAFEREGLMVYEGDVELAVELPPGALAGIRSLRGELSVQACDDRVCLPPATLPLSLQLR